MTDIVIPSWITPEQEDIELLDDGTTKFEPQFGRGQSQRQSYGAPRFKISRRHTVRQGEEAGLVATLSALRGGYHTVRTTVKRVLRGSFGLAELVTNGTFAAGTSGWSPLSSSIHTVADRISKFQVGGAQTGSAGVGYGVSRTISTTQYRIYILRAAFFKGVGVESYAIAAGSSPGAGDYFSSAFSTTGLLTAAGMSKASSMSITVAGLTASGSMYDDFVSCAQISSSAACLVDNGGNSLTYSNEFDNAVWVKTGATAGANAIVSYDLTSTADSLIETSANSRHAFQQALTVSSSPQDFAFSVAVRPAGRTFVALTLSSLTNAEIVFNLSGAGSIASTSSGSWTDVQGFIKVAGGAANPYYIVSITGRKTDASTTMTPVVGAATGASTVSYTGTNALVALYLSDATTFPSSVPTRLIRNSSSSTAASGQSGSALRIKGLPVSTSGLALPGDFVEIGGELKRLTAVLSSDALGLGYLQFEPELVRSPIDNDPVIFFEPFGRFVISNIRIQPRVSDVQLSYDLEQIYE